MVTYRLWYLWILLTRNIHHVHGMLLADL